MLPVGVGLHQGSSLSPYLFRHEYGCVGPRDKGYIPVVHVIYADDIVLCGTGSEVVENKLEEWGRAMEDRGLKININKTVYLRFIADGNLKGNSDISIQGENLERVNTFKYLGTTFVPTDNVINARYCNNCPIM